MQNWHSRKESKLRSFLTKDDIVQDSYTTQYEDLIAGITVTKHSYVAPKQSVDAVELGHIEAVLITDEPLV